ncbi:hypothetical protein [Winogradskyella ursingii]|uniref:hypothetical protein n=1 Tax=Winogradskyella ursingii TaxID=2686079 RepID=UPI0015CDC119|nr:hypothetical protein [Winogradskyella ursingii]
MKNTIKIISASLLLFVMAVSCDEDNNNLGEQSPETGWVQFASASSTTGQTVPSHSINVQVNVPIYKEGLSISYTTAANDGDYTQFVLPSDRTGSVFADPSDYDRVVSINIPLQNMEVGRDFVTSFDVILTAVDKQGVTVGIQDTRPTVHTVTIPCSNPDVLPNDYFVGNYTIEDVMAQIGPGNGTENIGSGTVTLTVDPSDPNRRLFSASILPAFTGGALVPFALEFTTDDTVTLGQFSSSGISCSGPAYGFDAASEADSVPWDICNDQVITINYTEDPLVGCGGPYAASFRLTKI